MIINLYNNIEHSDLLRDWNFDVISQFLDNHNIEGLCNIYVQNLGDAVIRHVGGAMVFNYLYNANKEKSQKIKKDIKNKLSEAMLDCWGLCKKERIVKFYLNIQLFSIRHQLDSLINAYDAFKRGDHKDLDINTFLSGIIEKHVLLRMFMKTGFARRKEDLSRVVEDQIKTNKQELELISSFFSANNLHLSVSQIYNSQNMLWEVLSSNSLVVTNDLNYHAETPYTNGIKTSLYAVEKIDLCKFDTSLWDYTNFVEAVSAFKYKGFITTYGFFHKIMISIGGLPYQVEYPLIMMDNKIMSIKSKYLYSILSFEKKFLFNHDLWHHLLPVYAKHFMINHPDAPITYGGYRKSYIKYAQKTRFNKQDYEIGLGICQRKVLQKRFLLNPGLRVNQEKIFELYLNNLYKLYQENKFLLKDVKNMIEHLLANGINRFLTIFSFADLECFSNKCLMLNQIINELGIGEIVVSRRAFMDLLLNVGLVDDEGGDVFRQIEKNISKSSTNHLLWAALAQMGFLKFKDDNRKRIVIRGINKFRRISIVYPQKKEIKGFTERVQSDCIRYGNKYVDPMFLLIEQYNAISVDSSVYNVRTYIKNKFQIMLKMLRRCFDAFGCYTSFNRFFLEMIDQKIADILDHKYRCFQSSESISLIKEVERILPSKAPEVKFLVREYNDLVSLAIFYMKQNNIKFSHSKKILMRNCISLS